MYVHKHVYVLVYIFVYMLVYVFVYMYVYSFVYKNVYAHVSNNTERSYEAYECYLGIPMNMLTCLTLTWKNKAMFTSMFTNIHFC